MKKFITILMVVSLCNLTSHAQGRFGVKGGLNFDSVKDVSENVDDTWSKKTGYHIGITYQAKVPIIGIAVQPELLFMRNRAESDMIPYQSLYIDNLVLPVNIQLGLDLLLLRPYVMVSPYISYAVGKGDMLSNTSWDDFNRLSYGYGLGAGLDIWKLSVSGKYNFGLGKIQSSGEPINGTTLKNAKMEGFQLSVTIWF